MINGSFSFENNKSAEFPPLTQDGNSHVVVNERYELRELIGQGAMARVYKGLDRVLDRLVAVKLLREEYGSDQNFVARFLREARAVARITSPNIVDIYDYGQFQNTYFIVMPYIEGTNLKDFIRQERALPVDQAVTIASEVLVGLAAAHSQGIIHRDVKPQNILIRAGDQVAKLTDFGVAYALDGVQITTNGMTIGTAYYMAPEQASGGQVGPFTDLYAVGVVLFEMLAGRLPFLADNHMQIMLQHVNDLPPTLHSIGVPISPELDWIVQKALTKDPSGRFQSALEMREALLNIPLTGIMGGYDGIDNGATPQNLPLVNARPESYSRPASFRQPPVRPASRKVGFIVPLLLGVFVLAGLALLGLLLISNNGKQTTPTSLVALPVVTTGSNTTTVAASPTITSQPTAALPTATLAAPVQTAVLSTPIPATSTLAPLPTATPLPPTATQIPATATPLPSTPTRVPPTPTQVPPTPTIAVPTATVLPPSPNPGNSQTSGNSFTPYSLAGSYKRDDGTLYGRPEVALYGAGSGYEEGTISFKVDNLPRGRVLLVLTGLDDERRESCNLQVSLNGALIYNGPSNFPNAPTSDNGEGGSDRYWGQIEIAVPANLFKTGTNALVLRNNTPWSGQLGIPYILVNQLTFTNGN